MRPTLFAAVTAGLLGCAGAPRTFPTAAGETVRDSGGALRVADLPRGNVEHLGEELAVWGLTEVPDGSRMQAAEAMVDAITRAELLRRVQVTVAESALDLADGERQLLERRTAEAVAARLPGLAPIAHGWERLERDGTTVLRLAGRLQISRAALAPVIYDAYGAGHEAAAEALLARLFSAGTGD